jgi:hypothetical protein
MPARRALARPKPYGGRPATDCPRQTTTTVASNPLSHSRGSLQARATVFHRKEPSLSLITLPKVFHVKQFRSVNLRGVRASERMGLTAA